MATSLVYRLRKVLNTIRARCRKTSRRPDRIYYVGLPCTLTLDELVAPWHRDGAAAMRLPSVDRVIPKLGYVFHNCRFIEQAENARRAVAGRRKQCL